MSKPTHLDTDNSIGYPSPSGEPQPAELKVFEVIRKFIAGNPYGSYGAIDSQHGRQELIRVLKDTGLPWSSVLDQLQITALQELREARALSEGERMLRLDAVQSLLRCAGVFPQQNRKVHCEILVLLSMSADVTTAEKARREYLNFTGKRLAA